MEWIGADFLSALLAIILIDLVLAGDNAIVIGMAARNLPKEQQKKAIIWGTFGAIFIRVILTLGVVLLLKIPFLMLIGGIFLIWIAFKLLIEEKKHDIGPGKNLFDAVKTIVIADAVMGLDNVLAVAGAAQGSFILVVIGLLISVPIVIWGSTIIIKWIERFPVIIYIGAGVIAYTAGHMITDEPILKEFFTVNPFLKWGLNILIVVGVLTIGKYRNDKARKLNPTS